MIRHIFKDGPTLAGMALIAVGLHLASSPAVAVEAGEKEETQVEEYEAEETKERPSIEDREGPEEYQAEKFIEEKQFQNRKAADRAIVRLKDLLETTSKDNAKRAKYLFELAEAYWDKSKFYEQEAFSKQDQCYALEDAGKKQELKQCRQRMKDMENESNRLRGEAVELYKEIVQNYPNFERMHEILFYLANNLDEAGRKDEAMQVYRKLLSNFPDSPYTPNVLLGIGEYYFKEKEDPERALKFYNKVKSYPDSSVYSYALYKAGWCHYNMQQKDKALDIFIDVIEYAKNHPDQKNAQALVNQTRKDIVKTYAAVGGPENAVPFFQDIADEREEVIKMTERLAILYSDDGKYKYSTKMYRKLIQMRKDSYKTIDYQYEIVRNFTSENPYRKTTIEELVKLMKLVQLAEQGKFEHFDEEKYAKQKTRVEQLVRQWATRFHREAQVTKNEGLYKMAYFAYDNYLETFSESKHRYKMTFFDAEILYHLRSWEEAAKRYRETIEMNPEGEYTKDAAHAQVLAYFKLVNTSEEQAELESPLKFEERDQAEEVKEDDSEEEEEELPEKKEISDRQKKLVEAGEMYMEYVPDGDRIVDVKYTMARVYYEHNHLEKALEMFENIAFNHPDHRLAVVSANLHLDTLNLLNDFEGLHEAVQAYMEKKPIDDEEFMTDVDRLNRAIRFKLCREEEDAENWKKSAECYVDFYRDFPNSKHVDKALYNAALSYERIKELGKAIQVRIFLLKAAPNSKLVPKTVFNIGGNYHALAVYSKAAQFYEKFIEIYPDLDAEEKEALGDPKKKAEDALANASTFRQGLGNYEEAIENFERYIELFGDREEYEEKAADIAFQIAEVYKKQERPEEAKQQYEEYLSEWADKGTEDRRLQAHVRIGLNYWEHEDREQALEKFEETLAVYERLAPDAQEKLMEGRDAAAQAKFMLGEDVYEDMEAINFEETDSGDLEENEEKMQEIFTDKMEVAEEAQKIYEEVIKFRRPDWAIAALYRIGSQYQNFAETIRNSPIPDRLNFNQTEIYKGLLEDKATVVEDKAVSAYKRAIDTAKNERWFNDYSRQAEVELAKLRPKEYGEPAEIRAEPTHLAPGYTRAKFIDELEGEEGRVRDLGDSGGGSPSGGSVSADQASDEGPSS